MKNVIIPNSIVSAKWLHKHLKAPNLIILDASIKKVTDVSDIPESKIQIPQTRFFDIKYKFSDVKAPFPNTIPSAKQFSKEAQILGINNDSAIIVYDDKGIYSSARVWYMFKAMGHNNVAVLDGGLPEWKRLHFTVEPKTEYNNDGGNFEASYNSNMFKDFRNVKNALQSSNTVIIDARSENRFNGLVPESRKGLRSGNIPNSVNLPYSELLIKGCIKNEKELNSLFNNKVKDYNNIIFSCGSGITACVLALGADISEFKNVSVYDGSWTEWGSLTKSEEDAKTFS